MINGLIYDVIQDKLDSETIVCPICNTRITNAGNVVWYYHKGDFENMTYAAHRTCMNTEYDVVFPMEVLTINE